MRIRPPHLALFFAFFAVVCASFFATNFLLQKSVSQFHDPYQGQNPNIVQDSAVLSFGDYGNGHDRTKGDGWLQRVTNCSWIDKRGELEINDLPRRAKSLKLIVEAAGSTSASRPEQVINVIANSSLIGKLEFSAKENQVTKKMTVPDAVVRRSPGRLNITFIESEPKTPDTFGLDAVSQSPTICLRTLSLIPSTKT